MKIIAGFFSAIVGQDTAGSAKAGDTRRFLKFENTMRKNL